MLSFGDILLGTSPVDKVLGILIIGSISTAFVGSSRDGMTVADTATFVVLLAAVLMKLKKNEMEKTAAQDPVPGFPSAKGAHWLVGHAIMMRDCGGEGFPKTHEKVYIGSADPKSGLASLWFFHIPSVVVMQADDVKKVLQSSPFRKSNRIIDTHLQNILGRRNLLSLRGKDWRTFRTAVHKSFNKTVVKQSRHAMHQVGNAMADSLLRVIRTKKSENNRMNYIVREVLPLMKFVTVDAFGLGILDGFEFGCSERMELQPFAASFDHLTSELIRRFSRPWDPTTFLYGLPTAANREYKMHRTRIRNFVQDQIARGRVRIDEEKRMENNRSGGNDRIQNHKDRCTRKRSYDLMTNLIKAASAEANKHADDAAHVKVVEETLNDVFITLLFGAYETASISLTYALYLLATHPEVQKNCVEEVQKIMGRREKQKTTESDTCKSDDLEDVSNDVDTEDLPYTKAVMMEAMRLFPAVPVTRRNLEIPVKLPSNGKILPKGQLVNISIWCVQRSEFNFPRPEEMIPERWVRRRRKPQQTDDRISAWEDRGLDDDDDINAIIAPANRDAFCTFAHGARNCVGKVFAMQETVIILACLVKKLKFDIVSPGYKLKPIICGFVQQPVDNLPMKIRERC